MKVFRDKTQSKNISANIRVEYFRRSSPVSLLYEYHSIIVLCKKDRLQTCVPYIKILS